MDIKIEQLPGICRKAAKGKVNESNMYSVIKGLETYGQPAGLLQAQNLTHYLAQLFHESGAFRYDREIVGKTLTKAQKGYEGRKDLGNTQKGDGLKFMGKTTIQLTGRGNVTKFYKWCVKKGLNPPDFASNPNLLNTDPWEGLAPIWYWDEGNPEGVSLNKYAKINNSEMVTKRVNGGLNGYADRLDYQTRLSLVMLGYGPKDVKAFQKAKGENVDGEVGLKTRQALHMALGGKHAFVQIVKVDKPVIVEKEVTVEKQVPMELSHKEVVSQVVAGPMGTLVAGTMLGVPIKYILVFAAISLIGFGLFYIVYKRKGR